MNLKRQLNWAAYIIFTLFILVTLLTHIYVMYSEIKKELANHNIRLTQLVELGATPERVYDTLALNYQYDRFSILVPDQKPFLYVAESAITWPFIAQVIKPTALISSQSITVGNIEIKYTLDTSAIIAQTQQLLTYFIIGTSSLYLLFSLLISLVIRRHIAKPLLKLSQALSRMSEFQFSDSEPQYVIDEIKPLNQALQKTRLELERKYKKLTAQNRQLQQEAFSDELTGFGNRVLFNKDLKRLLDPQQKIVHSGLLCFVRTTQLTQLNRTQGFAAGDTYMSKVAEYLKQSLSRNQSAQFYRINGADFAVLIPNLADNNINMFTDEFKSLLNDYQKILGVESIAYVGIVNYRTNDKLSETLAGVDTAASIAQEAQTNGWYLHKGTETQGSQQWKDTINEVLENTKVKLLHQPIVPTNGEKPLYLDLLARFYDNDRKELPTQTLIAMARRHGRATEIDRLVVMNITNAVGHGRLRGQNVGIKLTTSSVLSGDFLIWLERHLISTPEISQQLIFEISCNTIEHNYDSSKRLISVLHKCGSKISLANFGITPLSFKQLKILKPDFVKLDHSLTKEILSNKDDQFYVKQLVDVTHQLRTQVIVVGIETEEERFFIEGLRVDGMQGYFISEPASISELASSLYSS